MSECKSICRVCEGTENLCDLLAKENEDLLVMLESVANIYVGDDMLPKQICTSCIIRLQDAFEFVLLCEKTDRKLRENYENVKDEVDADESSMIEEYVEDEGECEKAQDVSVKMEPLEIEVETNAITLQNDTIKVECSNEDRDEIINNFLRTPHQTCEKVNTSIKNKTNLENSSDNKPKLKVEQEYHTLLCGANIVEAMKQKSLYKCRFCSDEFSRQKKFAEHVTRIHKRKPYPCPKCDNEYSRPSHLDNHIRIHDEGEQTRLLCNQCGQHFTKEMNLKRHIKNIHDNIKPFICEICKRCFARKEQLQIHSSSHITERPYNCSFCDKRFKTERQLLSHADIHAPDYEDRKKLKQSLVYQCEQCDKELSSRTAYNTHIRMHAGDRRYVCNISGCSKRFFGLGALYAHRNRHSMERKFACNECGSAFRQWTHLNQHKRLHTDNIRPYKCDFCENHYASKYTLKVHKRFHTGERPFQCPQCDECFVNNTSLKKHKLKHVDVPKQIEISN